MQRTTVLVVKIIISYKSLISERFMSRKFVDDKLGQIKLEIVLVGH